MYNMGMDKLWHSSQRFQNNAYKKNTLWSSSWCRYGYLTTRKCLKPILIKQVRKNDILREPMNNYKELKNTVWDRLNNLVCCNHSLNAVNIRTDCKTAEVCMYFSQNVEWLFWLLQTSFIVVAVCVMRDWNAFKAHFWASWQLVRPELWTLERVSEMMNHKYKSWKNFKV